MNAVVVPASMRPDAAPHRRAAASERVLRYAAAGWFVVALLGQWAFAAYLFTFYGASLVAGDFTVWNRLQAMGATPHIVGDTAGNLTFLAHALGAGLVALGGALQLVPWLRTHAPRFHRWNGRVFLLAVSALSLSGFYLVWLRGEPPDSFRELATTFNGLLILAFAALAYRNARGRRFAEHRRWALRLYLVSNAQWFMRIGAFAYFVVGTALGQAPGFRDPFFALWPFGCYLVPLLGLELYLRLQARGRPFGRIAFAAVLGLLTLAMGVGMLAFGAFSLRLISGAPLGVG